MATKKTTKKTTKKSESKVEKDEVVQLELNTRELLYLCQIFSLQITNEFVDESQEAQYITKTFAKAMKVDDLDQSTYEKIHKACVKAGKDPDDVIEDFAFMIKQPEVFIAKMGSDEG